MPVDRHLQPDITRRRAMATLTTLSTGFALAVRPISAETITTDSTGLLAGEVKIPTSDGEIPAYRAAPQGSGPFVVVLVAVALVASIGLADGGAASTPRPLDPAELVRQAAIAKAPREPSRPSVKEQLARYPVQLKDPLAFGKDLIEVTEARTLRRRYRHWGDWDREVADYKAEGAGAVKAANREPKTIRVGCVFFEDVRLECPQIPGGDGRPLQAAYTTPEWFRHQMQEEICPGYSDFMEAFSGGEVQLTWTFVIVRGLVWTFDGLENPVLSFQPQAISTSFERALAEYARDDIQMWVLCGGMPTMLNPADSKQRVDGPPYGISYTQWKLHQGYSLVITAPHLSLLVHEFNHRYLDNLRSIEGVQLTMFHGLPMLGYDSNDCGYDEHLNTYRSVYQHLIRPAMHRRFTLVDQNRTPREPFSGRPYEWATVADDLWFRVPEIGVEELAGLLGLVSLEIVGDTKERHRLFRVGAADQAKVHSPMAATGSDTDTRVNNLLSLATESCAVLATDTGHWLIVRPDLADLYVEMERASGRGGNKLQVYGWINQGVRPLVVLRASAALPVPESELDYFRNPVHRPPTSSGCDHAAAIKKDPDWLTAKKASEEKAGGSLTNLEGGVLSEFCAATDYSPLR